jgi:hypothetical protein
VFLHGLFKFLNHAVQKHWTKCGVYVNFLEGSGICQMELSRHAISVLRRGGPMDEFWNEIIYGYPGAKHVCDDFGVVLAHNGENDLMICRKCGKGWVASSRIKKKAIGKK